MKKLFEDDFSAGFDELGFGVVGNILGNILEDVGTGGFGHGFGFHEAEGSELANGLNDIDFLGAGGLENNGEFGFFFNFFDDDGGGRARGHSYRCSSGNAPFFFEGFDKFSSFQNGKFAQFFNKFY